MHRVAAVVLCLAVVVSGSEKAQDPLTNEDVVRLVKSGFSEAIVVQAARMNEARLDVSCNALSVLRDSGVGDGVISAMLKAEKESPHVSLLEPGVYVTRADAWALVPAEPVAWGNSATVHQPTTRGSPDCGSSGEWTIVAAIRT